MADIYTAPYTGQPVSRKALFTIADLATSLGRNKAHPVIGCKTHHGIISAVQIPYTKAVGQDCTEKQWGDTVEEPNPSASSQDCVPEHSLIVWPRNDCKPAIITITKKRLHNFTESFGVRRVVH